MERLLDLEIDLEQEDSGQWIADVVTLPGVMAYGANREDALAKVKALALQVIGDRLQNNEDPLTGRPLGESGQRDIAAFSGIGFRPALAF